MIAEIDSPFSLPAPNAPQIRVTIIYEDFASGARAKVFADRLAAELSCTCQLSQSLWRSELLECPSIALEAAQDAADCDYLIVSLRGDRVPGLAIRRWIEDQLDLAAQRDAALVVLVDAKHGKRRTMDAARHFFRTVCTQREVPFFSLMATEPGEDQVARFHAGKPAARFRSNP